MLNLSKSTLEGSEGNLSVNGAAFKEIKLPVQNESSVPKRRSEKKKIIIKQRFVKNESEPEFRSVARPII